VSLSTLSWLWSNDLTELATLENSFLKDVKREQTPEKPVRVLDQILKLFPA
jgi:hypothetical protein